MTDLGEPEDRDSEAEEDVQESDTGLAGEGGEAGIDGGAWGGAVGESAEENCGRMG